MGDDDAKGGAEGAGGNPGGSMLICQRQGVPGPKSGPAVRRFRVLDAQHRCRPRAIKFAVPYMSGGL